MKDVTLQMGICPLERGAGEEELGFERRGVRGSVA